MFRKILRICGVALLMLAPLAPLPVLALDTAGASCYADNCRAGDGQTAGGNCQGTNCVAGSGGTAGGRCGGDNCQAGNGGTGGGDCYGTNCLAGAGRTVGGMCQGTNCKAGNGGTMGGTCYGQGCTGGTRGSTSSPVPRPGMQAPPTSLADIVKQTAIPPDPRCPYNCQAWNPASNSCVGAPMNAC